jgi:hypothetical protein
MIAVQREKERERERENVREQRIFSSSMHLYEKEN